ncbi:hypothetical protein [Lactococcus lactis]|uniref:hypothetical protein n=1 Tax=Lactococcus lactis TaxID=1358 RepID=UPI0032E46910
MNKIVQVETVDVKNFQGLDWANTMLESGWTLLSVNGLTLLLGAEKEVAEQYEELLENRV